VNLNVNATLVVDVDSSPIRLGVAYKSGVETNASIRRDSWTTDLENARRRGQRQRPRWRSGSSSRFTSRSTPS